ncbi:MAG: hypothetical protein KF823_08180 [Xanthomonadales bacterium]|nr:hypothetical protein [Xanthomonadales bacterium]
MRVIYSTPRLENAERIAELLREGEVEVRVLFGPHFKRNTWRGANYRQAEDPGNWPKVMVVHNTDLAKARALLREAGVLGLSNLDQDRRVRDPDSDDALAAPSPRDFQAGRAANPTRPRGSYLEKPPRRPGPSRLRIVLVALVVLVALIQGARMLLR